MGTSTSKTKADDRLAIECMAKYMSISKQQLIDLRNRCYMGMDGKRKITRRAFNTNVQQCRIQEKPDAEVLDALFTMWDLHGEDRILCPPFILSLAPLACEDQDLESTLRFSLDIFERETKGVLSAERLVFILKCKYLLTSCVARPKARLMQYFDLYRLESDCFLFWRFGADTSSDLQGRG